MFQNKKLSKSAVADEDVSEDSEGEDSTFLGHSYSKTSTVIYSGGRERPRVGAAAPHQEGANQGHAGARQSEQDTRADRELHSSDHSSSDDSPIQTGIKPPKKIKLAKELSDTVTYVTAVHFKGASAGVAGLSI